MGGYDVGDYENAVKCSQEAAKRIPTGILGMTTSEAPDKVAHQITDKAAAK
ncbi:MAG TPA: hypothetical protein VGG57_04300 [Stellaceae bacterium]|jgi:hypothetical protein